VADGVGWQKYDGSAERLIESAGGSAVALARTLTLDFSSFRDEAVYQGRIGTSRIICSLAREKGRSFGFCDSAVLETSSNYARRDLVRWSHSPLQNVITNEEWDGRAGQLSRDKDLEILGTSTI
jgi:hypothetical protein